MIAGFITGGDHEQLGDILIRGMGPSLSTAGIVDYLADPFLSLQTGGRTLANNDDWKSTQQLAIEQSGIPPSDDRESAIRANLAGTGAGCTAAMFTGSSGTALVEVYQLNAPSN